MGKFRRAPVERRAAELSRGLGPCGFVGALLHLICGLACIDDPLQGRDAGVEDAGTADTGVDGGIPVCVFDDEPLVFTCEGDEDYCRDRDGVVPPPENGPFAVPLVAAWSRVEGDQVIVQMLYAERLFTRRGHEIGVSFRQGMDFDVTIDDSESGLGFALWSMFFGNCSLGSWPIGFGLNGARASVIEQIREPPFLSYPPRSGLQYSFCSELGTVPQFPLQLAAAGRLVEVSLPAERILDTDGQLRWAVWAYEFPPTPENSIDTNHPDFPFGRTHEVPFQSFMDSQGGAFDGSELSDIDMASRCRPMGQ